METGRTVAEFYAPKQVPPHLQPVISSIVEGDFDVFKAVWRPTVLGYVKALARDDTAHPLLHAAHRGRAEMVRFLLDQGLSPRQRGTVHPYTGDCMTVSELQGISPLELVNKMLFMHPRKSKRREELLAVKELLVAADLKQQAQLEAYQKQFPAEMAAPGGGATPAKLPEGLYGAAGGVDSPATADASSASVAAVLGYDAAGTPAAPRARHAAAAEAARRRSPSPPSATPRTAASGSSGAAAAAGSATSSSRASSGAAATPAGVSGEGNPKRRRVVVATVAGEASTPGPVSSSGWQPGGGSDSRKSAASRTVGFDSSARYSEAPSTPFAAASSPPAFPSYLKESPLSQPKPVEVDEDAVATTPLTEQRSSAVCSRIAAVMERQIYPALLAPAAGSAARPCAAVTLVGAAAGFPAPAALIDCSAAPAQPVVVRAFRTLTELCTAATLDEGEEGCTAAVSSQVGSGHPQPPRPAGFATTSPLFSRQTGAGASPAQAGPPATQGAAALALLPQRAAQLQGNAPVAAPGLRLQQQPAGAAPPSPTMPASALPTASFLPGGLAYDAAAYFCSAAAPPFAPGSVPPSMARASYAALPLSRQRSAPALTALPTDATVLVLPASVPVPPVDAFLPLAARLVAQAVEPLAAAGRLEGLPAALSQLVDAAVAQDATCCKARCMFDAVCQSLGAALASQALAHVTSFSLVGRRQAPEPAAVAKALAALPAGLPRLTHLPVWPFLCRLEQQPAASAVTPCQATPAPLAGTKRPRVEEGAADSAVAVLFPEGAASPAPAGEAGVAETPAPVPASEAGTPTAAAGIASRTAARGSRSHAEALHRTAAALWAQTAWAALAASRSFTSLTGAAFTLADVLSVHALPLDDAAQGELVFLTGRLTAA